MKGNKKVIDILNQVLTGELTAINQYFLHSRICANWGYKLLAKKQYDESIEEMKHAQKIIDRVLFLEGIPNLQKLNSLRIGETVPEQFEADMKLEYEAIALLKNGIKLCYEVEDYVTKDLFEDILEDEEEHVDWLETQLGMIKQLGVENYLSQHIFKHES